MSGACTAFSAGFVAWVTIRLSKLAYYGRSEEVEIPQGENIALAGAGLVAGLATAFCTSIWFSAVEGEVYAMSLFFTCLTLWSMIKWYTLPDLPSADRWLMLTIFSAGLAVGVHLLSILTLPAMAIFYYFKKWEGRTTIMGTVLSVLAGVAVILFIQSVIVVGIPKVWHGLEIFMVNSLGMPVHSGVVPTILLVIAGLFFGLRYAHRKNSSAWQQFFVATALLVSAYSTVGVVLIRAEAKPPVNMNNPDNVTSLLPYLNREQYGERSLVFGPSFDATVIDTEVEERYGLVNGKYEEAVTYKITPEYPKKDMMFFPRMSDGTQGRPNLYKQWMGLDPKQPLPGNRPNFLDNVKFLWNYQLGQMYWRYFMWNFAGRQNGDQGFYSWDKSSGNWISGIGFLDAVRLGNQAEITEEQRTNPARNTYFLIPLLFGLLGLFWHAGRRKNEFIGLLGLFVITGIGIIIYTNQPPNEPRERDYVLVGSFFTFCIWMGMAVPALYSIIRDKIGKSGVPVAAGVGALVLIAPLLMATQNFDDHSRREHKGSRDYAANFLNSVEENAIIFTYGDNDTYPLWYAQEVENIRRDVRVVNLSLIAVDWYIDLLRRKVNESPAINLTIPAEQLRGHKRNQVFRVNQANQEGPCSQDRPRSLDALINELASDQPFRNGGRTLETYYSSCNVTINVDKQRAAAAGLIPPGDEAVDRMPVRVNRTRLLKDEMAILDIINSNMYDRPIYWAVTCQESKLMGLKPYLMLQGLGLKLTVSQHANEDEYGIIGSGQVDTDWNYNLMLNEWKWGNFDQVDTYVNNSYKPALQAMQLTMRRTAMKLMEEGQQAKAMEIVDQYFAAFPDFNFPYFYSTSFMIDVYWQAREWNRALPHMEILARNTADRLKYYASIDDDILLSSYQDDYQRSIVVMQRLIQAAQQSGDQAIQQRMNSLLEDHLYLLQQRQTPG
jgi:hypothetical protein